jgi:type III secretory pathway component EscV
MFKKFVKGAGITGIVVGVVSYVSGVDLAPADVDAVMYALSILATVGPAIVTGIKNKFFSKGK